MEVRPECGCCKAPTGAQAGSRSLPRCVDKPSQSQTLSETHDTPVLENDILRAEITPDGKLDLLHKAGGRWYRDVLTLEDTADTGHSYISLPLAGDAPVGPGEPVSMKYTRDAVCQEAVLSFLMRLPEALNEDRTARSSRLVACPVTLTLRLHAGEPFLRASWQIENRARDHRLRMLVRTGLNADATTALSPFDLVQHRRSELDVRLCSESRHNSGMVSLSDGAAGFSVLNSDAYSRIHHRINSPSACLREFSYTPAEYLPSDCIEERPEPYASWCAGI